MPYSITFSDLASSLDASNRDFANITCTITNDDVANAPPCRVQLLKGGTPTPQNYSVPPLAIGASYSFTVVEKWQCQEADIVIAPHNVSNSSQDDGGVFTDQTTNCNNSVADSVSLTPAVPAVSDAYYFGDSANVFNSVEVNCSTPGVGTWTIVWEYWNGSAWAALPDLVDPTNGWRPASSGTYIIAWGYPTDWVTNAVNGVTSYWVRARVSAYTAVTTAPTATTADLGRYTDWAVQCSGRHTTGGTGTSPAGASEVSVNVTAHLQALKVIA